MKPFEKQLARLNKLGIRHYQEFSGFIGPRYWKITYSNGNIKYACKVKSLKEIADQEETAKCS